MVWHSAQTPVKSLVVVLVVLWPMYLTEVTRFCFQEVGVDARIQVAEVDSEERISWEMDFSLWDKESSPVNTSHTSKSSPAPSTPCTFLFTMAYPIRSHKAEPSKMMMCSTETNTLGKERTKYPLSSTVIWCQACGNSS